MNQRRRFIYFAGVCLAGRVLPVAAAVRGDEAMYIGGTIRQAKEKTEGTLDMSPSDAAVFRWKGGEFKIPYKTITSLEYGQKAGRRIGVAIAISPVALLSKKRKHFLSIAFADEKGEKQGAVFELAKGQTRGTISTFETRSGVKLEFESEEAKKNYGN